MKQLILDILPRSLSFKLKSITNKYRARKAYDEDFKRFYKYSNTYETNKNKDQLLALIIARYHVIEKGLSMPDMRLGFGKQALLDLIEFCQRYARQYNISNDQFLHALSVVLEYKTVHKNANYELERQVEKSIDGILKYYKPSSCQQTEMTKEAYFEFQNAPFPQFSASRHSLRNYVGNVDVNVLIKAVDLAQNAPSSCNRQSSRVYLVENRDKVMEVLSLQNGNRGFGHLSDKVIVLTSEIGSFGRMPERNQMFVDGGIYAMNLLYALHYYQVGACALNWCSSHEDDVKLRKLLDIKPSEVVIMVITCGNVPEKFKVALSPRTEVSNVISIV